jgi:methylated-DNA-[protein]-cysteine S-methyltransferase
MTQTAYAYCDSPLGLIEIGGSATAVATVHFAEIPREGAEPGAVVLEAQRQLSEYFAGMRRDFSVRLDLCGTAFQVRVWAQMLAVPFGETVTYQAIARALGMPRAARAVGGACGQNPVAVIVPCHRVVGSSGGLTGYAGGVWRKEWLLRHESAILV